MAGHIIENRRLEIAAGVAMFLASTYLIYDAFEGRGRKRAFLERFLP